ncbi:MAG TPA: class I SAM-dependent methyltransferase, partial [Bryobacterales bacterium]|nr:class I SAM-dependent methyltransferase [Bryobacterales bacterium]
MNDEIWKDASVAQRFLQGVRGGIPFAKEQIEILIRLIEANGKPLRAFADLGCGSGVVAAAILARFPRAQATLVDFSPPMLKQAKAQLQNHGRRVRFVVADLGERAWMKAVRARAPFDLIASGFCIHHQPDKRKRQLYAEIFALLRPGGMFVNIEHVSSPTQWVEAAGDELMIDTIHKFHAG